MTNSLGYPRLRRFLKYAAWGLAILVGVMTLFPMGRGILMGIGMVLYFIFISSPCWTEPIHLVASPDRKFKAILWEADCGATTSATYIVYLLPFDAKPKLNDETVLYSADYVNVCGLYWTTPSNLVLEIAGEGKRRKEPKKSLPLSVITKDSEMAGEISFDFRRVSHAEHCTIGWRWEP